MENDFKVPKIYKMDQLDKIEKFPCMLKFTRGGYDGKGNIYINNMTQLQDIVKEVKGEYFVEELIDFEREISVLVAKNKRRYGCIQSCPQYPQK